jgi:hypothetical protein
MYVNRKASGPRRGFLNIFEIRTAGESNHSMFVRQRVTVQNQRPLVEDGLLMGFSLAGQSSSLALARSHIKSSYNTRNELML